MKDSEKYRNRDSYKNNYNRSNTNTNSTSKPSQQKVEILPPDSNNSELFPELNPNLNKIVEIKSNNESSINFKSILTNVIEGRNYKKNDVPPGWVRLSTIKGNTVFEHGPLTPYMIRTKQKEEFQ